MEQEFQSESRQQDDAKTIAVSQHEKEIRKARRESRKEARNEFIRNASAADLLTQKELAVIFDMTQSSISRIVRNAETK